VADRFLKVKYVYIDGNVRTRDGVIERELQEVYDAESYGEIVQGLRSAQKSLQSLGIFKQVHIVMDEGPTADEVNLKVSVEETNLLDGSVMLENDGVNGKVNVKNVFGTSEKLSFTAKSTTDRSEAYHFTFGWPRFSPLNAPCEFATGKTKTHYGETSGYTEHVRSYGASMGGAGKFKAGYSVDVRDLEPTTVLSTTGVMASAKAVADDCRPSTKGSVRCGYRDDTRDHPFCPSRGTLRQADAEVAGIGGVGDVQFSKISATYQRTMGFGSRNLFNSGTGPVFSLGLFAGFVAPWGRDKAAVESVGGSGVRINDRFFLNSPLLLRGFEFRGIGPRALPEADLVDQAGNGGGGGGGGGGAGGKGPEAAAPKADGFALGGEAQVLASARVEFPFPLPLLNKLGIRGQCFTNAGNSLPLQHMRSVEAWKRTMRASAGCGFVVKLPLGRLEINYVGWSRRFAGDIGGHAKKWNWGISFHYL
jgi:outer membrane protein assembly factor BamA